MLSEPAKTGGRLRQNLQIALLLYGYFGKYQVRSLDNDACVRIVTICLTLIGFDLIQDIPRKYHFKNTTGEFPTIHISRNQRVAANLIKYQSTP